jgi:hypothetical protein
VANQIINMASASSPRLSVIFEKGSGEGSQPPAPLVTLGLFLCSPAVGFDTFWHAQATDKVAEEFVFSEDARNIMKLGNFSPDLFGR